VVICLERGADLHTAQLTPLPLAVSCFSKIQIDLTFLVPAHPCSLGKRAAKRACVCVCVCVCVTILKSFRLRNAGDIRDPRRLRSRLSSRGETNQCARESVICRSSCYTPRTIEINLRPATNKTPLSSLRRTRETNSNDNPYVNLIYYFSLERNLRILGMLLYGYEIFGMKRRFRTLPVIGTAHLWLF